MDEWNSRTLPVNLARCLQILDIAKARIVVAERIEHRLCVFIPGLCAYVCVRSHYSPWGTSLDSCQSIRARAPGRLGLLEAANKMEQ